jgi:hypothetical protein
VQEWLNTVVKQRYCAEDRRFDQCHFDSKENTTTSHPPELDIVFAGGDGSGQRVDWWRHQRHARHVADRYLRRDPDSAMEGQRVGLRFSGHGHDHGRDGGNGSLLVSVSCFCRRLGEHRRWSQSGHNKSATQTNEVVD